MLRQIEPERIICYNTPFPEMEGNIIFVDYELSSWKYQNHSKSSKYAKYLTGQLSPVKSRAILIKRGYVFPKKKKAWAVLMAANGNLRNRTMKDL